MEYRDYFFELISLSYIDLACYGFIWELLIKSCWLLSITLGLITMSLLFLFLTLCVVGLI